MIDHCIKDIFSLESRLKFDAILQFQMNLAERFPSDSPFCILICGVDNFKHYDESGAKLVMEEFGKYLLENTRKSDVVAKLSHNKFIILAPHLDHTEGMEFAKKLQFNLQSQNFSNFDYIRCSIAIGEYIDLNQTKEEFITKVNGVLNQVLDTHTVTSIHQ